MTLPLPLASPYLTLEQQTTSVPHTHPWSSCSACWLPSLCLFIFLYPANTHSYPQVHSLSFISILYVELSVMRDTFYNLPCAWCNQWPQVATRVWSVARATHQVSSPIASFICSCCFVTVMSNSFATPWTVAHQAPLSTGFSRQEYWSGLPFPSLGDLPNPGIEPMSPVGQAYSLPLSHQGSPRGQTFISCLSYMGSQTFYHCATWDALFHLYII